MPIIAIWKDSFLWGERMNKGKMGRVIKKDFKRNKVLYLMVLPVIAFYIIFSYIPMSGIIIAFKDFKPALGIYDSPWTSDFGFKHFISFFQNPVFWRLIKNTITLSLGTLILGFPAPIILAMMLSEVRFRRIKKTVQTITYFPHFISLVVVCGILKEFCLSDGLFNTIGSWFGMQPTSMLQQPKLFPAIYILSSIWQKVGWDSIIYIAAIAGVDTQLYEAAELDGCRRFRKLWYITLPSIKPTIVILLIMAVGNMMSVGSEKILLLYNESIYETADVISTYMYRKGLLEFNFSYSTAVNLFNSTINFSLVYLANMLSKKLTDESLF